MKYCWGGFLLVLGLLLWTLLLGHGEGRAYVEPVAAGLEPGGGVSGTAVTTPLSTTTTYLPVVLNRYDAQFPAPMFGMQTYGSTDTTSTYYNYLMDSQASWVRSQVNWIDVEPVDATPAVYNWNSTDRALAVSQADKGGLQVIAVIDYVPVWARLVSSEPNGRIRPDALDDFGAFVQAAVERYDGDGYLDAPGKPIVKHWEMFNEPDLLTTRWGLYGDQYANMLSVAYTAVKAADPSAQVLFGGMAYDWFDYQGGPFAYSFLEDVLAAGGGSYFDVMSFHMYPLFAGNWGGDPTGVQGKAADIRAKLAAYGLDKPLVITEAGWHSSADTPPPSSNAEQVVRLVQLVTHSFAADVKAFIWFMLYDPGDFLPSYGLITTDSPPVVKPAYTAYQTAVNMLGNAQFVNDLTPPATGDVYMEAFQFHTNSAWLYVAWMNPYQTTAVSTFTVAGHNATLYSALGAVVGIINDTDGDGLLTVTVTDEPIYIRVNN